MGVCAIDVIYTIIILTQIFVIAEVSAVCGDGKFGRDCLLECHCTAGNTCGVDGSCTACKPGWAGPTCQLVIENVAINKTASQKPSDREEKYASYAIDGDINTFSWVQEKTNPGSVSLTVDLGREYLVHAIKVVFNATVDKRRAGYSVVMSRNKDDEACYSHKTDDYPEVSSYLSSCNGTTRYVTVANSRDTSPDSWSTYPNLVIAEIEIFEDKDCSIGTFGSLCDKVCGRCLDKSCDRESGSCPGECKTGFFGADCMQECSDTCIGQCSKDNGRCSDICPSKYYGDFCNMTCSIGCKECTRTGECIGCLLDTSHGRYCNNSCPNCKGGCQQSNGVCKDGCKGKFYGEKCEMTCKNCANLCSINGTCTSEGCLSGHYGDKCNITCPPRCVVGENCDRDTGYCGKCEANHYGDSCQYNCSSNCKDGTCYRNGSCINSCANLKYHGEKCDSLCSNDIPDCMECKDVEGTPQCLKCDQHRYGNQCLSNCPDSCESCISYTECAKCKTGYSGDSCQNQCSIENCNKCTMDNLDACVECKDGWYGDLCDQNCSNECKSCINKSVCSACHTGKFLIDGICVNCTKNCVACEFAFNCSACVAGRFGVSCDETCPTDCLECTSEDLCTKCREGRDGSKCLCSHNCTRYGDISQWCNVTTGECLNGCVDGKFGNKCDLECPARCLICDQKGGKCSSCVSGYYGINCDKQCGNCMPEGSKIECERNSGACFGKCQNEYFGLNCNKSCGINCDPRSCDKDTGNCVSCSPGFYNDQCEKHCPVNCDGSNGQEVCDKRSGKCRACKDGFFGDVCDQNCSATCETTPGRNGCDRQTGKCFKCKQRFYGDNCKNKCGNHCASDCNQTSGICDACNSNHYLPYCNGNCPDNCGPDPMGSSKIMCNRYTGECMYCQPGFYGEMCEKDCPSDCFKHCNKAIGICHHCKIGFHGDYCQDQCSPQCSHSEQYSTGSCNQTSGHCNDGCKSGFKSPMCRTALPVQGKPLAIIIGVVVAIVVASIIMIIIAVICYRYRKAANREKINARKVNGAHKRELNGQNAEEINPLIQSYSASVGKGTNLNKVNETKVDGAESCIQNTVIPVSGFTEYLQERRINPEWFKDEFTKLPKGLVKPCITATNFGNRGRCRYKQLYPYDHNRVKLEADGDDVHDFINASYVDGYNHPQAFIAAQGPTESTVNDFWRMIYQKDCGKIVMLTNLFEELKKCERYWPEVHETLTYGKYEVTNVFETELPSYTVRHLRAIHSDTKEEKDFLHLHFTAWPDRGVPDNPSVMLNFRDKVMEEETSLHGPILVHCSAGIGRTGTFVALDYLLRQAKEESHIDVFSTVKQMRNERTNFVQTDIQYEFVHNAIYEALNVKEFEISEDKFIQHYHSMTNAMPGCKTKLEEQFEMINEMSPELDESHFKAGCMEENIEKNRHPDILPIDMYRAYLSTPVKGSNEYINAIFLPTCTNKTGFLVTQTPMPNTVTDFWRLVYDQHVSNIVMMNNILCEDESIEEYWSSKTSDSTYGPFRVKFDGSQEDYEGYSVMRIQLTYTKWGEPSTLNVKLFRFEGWQDGKSLPFSPALTSLISQVSGSSKDSKTEPIIVHCMDGAERSGLFCAVSAILERLKLEKKVNIPQIIMQLRARRPQLIKTMEQFDFCYRAVADHLEANQIYTNVL